MTTAGRAVGNRRQADLPAEMFTGSSALVDGESAFRPTTTTVVNAVNPAEISA